MERADTLGGIPPAGKGRRVIAAGFALALHAVVFWVLSYVPQKPLSLPKPPIPVKLVFAEVAPKPVLDIPETPERVTPPLEPKPAPIEPELEPEPIAPEPETPPIEIILDPTPTQPTLNPSPTETQQEPQAGNPIPDKWRLPAGARIPLDKTRQPATSQLEILAKSLECLGFDADCAAQRKSIFGEDQLSGTDLVWMANHAHSGLSNSDLFGLSETQIRERLGIPTAGKNGLMIIPGIGINGPWWDALHGVNKACDYSVGVNENGSKELRKNCKPLKPTSRDKIRFIPKPVE